MRIVRGLIVALGLFLASFALHIVGGATDQRWLFAIAVGLIYLTATGFGANALIASGLAWAERAGVRTVLGIGSCAGVVFTIGALWAANGRAFAWWQLLLAPGLVLVTSATLLGLRRLAGGKAK
ncbi:MAG: hypothetical protein ABIP13_08340, partial [Tepidiformaceae bacterium]